MNSYKNRDMDELDRFQQEIDETSGEKKKHKKDVEKMLGETGMGKW